MTTKTDSKKRVVLPGANPGDIYDVQEQEVGRYVLVRLERPAPKAGMSRKACLRAMDNRPLHLAMSWEELERLTREP
jgi:hypothetical protein